MKTFYCDTCGALLFFENVKCLACEHTLGFIPEVLDLQALEPVAGPDLESTRPGNQGPDFRLCENSRTQNICNWLVPKDSKDAFCVACSLNHTIPDLTVAGNHDRWYRLESAKRRLVYTLLSLKLPLAGKPSENRPALLFDFLGDTPGGPAVLTGHENGLITLNIAEADDVERERRRVTMHEPYRTLLGHFRHEVGHYYWDQLIANTTRLDRFRELFGDERRDYGTALKAYHAQGAPPDWQNRLISEYASAHPWEDWAETWAHYLHMVDSVETAAGFGMSLHPKTSRRKYHAG